MKPNKSLGFDFSAKIKSLSDKTKALPKKLKNLLKKENFKTLFTEKLDVFVSALIIATGICFIVCDYILFKSGGVSPYSAERVGKFLIFPMIMLGITAVFAFIDGLRKNRRTLCERGGYNEMANDRLGRITKKLLADFDLGSASEEVKSELSALRKKRVNTLTVAISTTSTAFVFSVITLINTDKFTVEHVNADIARAACVIIFASVLSFIAWCVYSSQCFNTRNEERRIIREALRENPDLRLPKAEKEQKGRLSRIIESEKAGFILKALLLAVSLVLIVLGIMNGGMADVLSKAVAICMECIGIG